MKLHLYFSYFHSIYSIYVPCRSTLAIMSVQFLLSFDACSTSHAVQVPAILLMTLLINVILSLPLARFPSIFPVIAKYFPYLPFIIIGVKNIDRCIFAQFVDHPVFDDSSFFESPCIVVDRLLLFLKSLSSVGVIASTATARCSVSD